MREKSKLGKLKYKYKVYLGILSIAVLAIIAFAFFNIHEFKKNVKDQTLREAEYTASNIAGQVDDRLSNLWQYYSYTVSEDAIVWMMENEVSYSDYTQYHKAQELLADNKIFGDYIDDYSLINFQTGWVLARKGMFPYSDVQNTDEIDKLFINKNETADKNYWYYNDSESNLKQVSREYRTTVETEGLNIVIKLPSHTLKVYGMLLVNINMNSWRNWILSQLDEFEEVVVLDPDGNLAYASDQAIATAFLNLPATGYAQIDGCEYMVGEAQSTTFGFTYYVLKDIGNITYSVSKLNSIIIVSFLAFIMITSLFLSHIIYRPVEILVKNVSENDSEVSGDEIEYIADKFAGIKYDKQKLQETVSKNKNKIQELFELRLIRGEVRSDDEWNEYFKGLNISPYKYFATAVMVLDLKGEFEAEDNISEDSVCLKMVEEVPEDLQKLSWMPLVYNACTMFCIFGDDDENEMLHKIMSFYDGMQQYAQDKFGLRILMGVSATHTEHRHIYAAYRESINALMTNGESEGSSHDEDCKFYLGSMTARVNSFNLSYEKDIQAAIKAVDQEQCYRVVDDFSHYLTQITSHDDSIFLTTRFMNAAIDAASNTNLKISDVFPDGIRVLYRSAITAAEPSRLRRYLKYAVIDPILAARSAKLENGSSSMMEQIENIIFESGGNITLAECADALNVHQTYIWKILKMERGKTFTEYVEEYKVSEAKRLLVETSLSVNEIAEKLGYTNAQNFIRFFSKSTGLTPGKFRKLS